MSPTTGAAVAFLAMCVAFTVLAAYSAWRTFRAPTQLESAQAAAVTPLALAFALLLGAITAGVYFGRANEPLAWQLFICCTMLAAACALMRHQAVHHRDQLERQLGII